MRNPLCLLLLTAGFLVGCAATPAKAPIPTNPLTSRQLVPGKQYEVMTGLSNGAEISYVGTVANVNDESVTLNNAYKRVKIEKPLSIPIFGKMFTNKSVGASMIDAPITIKHQEITGVAESSSQ